MQMFYFIENQYCLTQPIVQLNHGLIFSFFQVCWEHSSQASYFRNNEPVTVRLPIKGKPTTTSLLSASCLLTFSDNSEACFFCTSKLSIQKLFMIHFAVSRLPFTQTVTLAYYTDCEAKKKKIYRYIYIYIALI